MLSVVIVAWNEERNLPRVIASVKDLADEIVVVVDKASIDKTAVVAKKLGGKVYFHEHLGIVEPMRSFAIAKAKYEWILLLDADEEVSEGLAKKIVEVTKNPSVDFVRTPRKNIIFGKWIQSDHWWPDYVYRLFKKDTLTLDNAIHSVPFTRGKGMDFPADEKFSIIHHHYSSVSEYVEKLNRYTDHQVDVVLSRGYRFVMIDLLLKPFEEFISQLFARHGYRDGLHGLALGLLQAFSELVLYLKIWQNSGFLQENVDPREIRLLSRNKFDEYRWWEYQVKIEQANLIKKIWLKILRKLGI